MLEFRYVSIDTPVEIDIYARQYSKYERMSLR